MPASIATRDFALGGPAVAAVVEAAQALEHLEGKPPRVSTMAALARNLLRSESASVLSHRRRPYIAQATGPRGYQQAEDGPDPRRPRPRQRLGHGACHRTRQRGALRGGGHPKTSIARCCVSPMTRTSRDWSATSRTGSVATTTTRWARHTSRRRPSDVPDLLPDSASSSRRTASRRSPKQRSLMPSSRTSIRSSTAMDATARAIYTVLRRRGEVRTTSRRSASCSPASKRATSPGSAPTAPVPSALV